jgi:hypothetical protein
MNAPLREKHLSSRKLSARQKRKAKRWPRRSTIDTR